MHSFLWIFGTATFVRHQRASSSFYITNDRLVFMITFVSTDKQRHTLKYEPTSREMLSVTSCPVDDFGPAGNVGDVSTSTISTYYKQTYKTSSWIGY